MRIIQPIEKRYCSGCKKFGHYQSECKNKKKPSSSPAPSSSRKLNPYQAKPDISKFKACLSDSSDEDIEHTYHISQSEKDALLGEDIGTNSMECEDSKEIVVVGAKTTKDHNDSAKPSHHHHPHQQNTNKFDVFRQKQKIQILNDELRLLYSEITFCTTTTDINNLKKKYNLI